MGTANLRKFFGDDRIHVIAGHVIVENGETSHFFINDEKNVVLSVEINHYGTVVRANLSNTPGVWTIPDVGTEVLVGFDNGEFEGEAYVIGTYGATNKTNAEIPTSVASQTFNVAVTGDANIVVASGSRIRLHSDTRIELSSGDGHGGPAALLSDLEPIWDYIARQFDHLLGHSHNPTTPTIVVESTIPPGSPSSSAVPSPTGSTIVTVE